jgi:O-antigen ligase
MTTAPSTQPRDTSNPLFWFFAFALFATFFVFDQDIRTSTYDDFVQETEVREQWSEGGSRSRQIATVALGVLGGVGLLLPSRRRLRLTDTLAVLFGIYLIYIASSMAWSIDVPTTRRRLVVLLFFIVCVIGLARQLPPRLLPALVMVIMGGYLVVGLASELALGTFAPWSGQHRFAGTTHPNIQANFLASMCLAAWAVHKQPGGLKPIALLVLAAGLVFLLLTRSRTAMLGFLLAFGFAFAVVADRQKSFKSIFGLSWIACAVTLVLFLVSSDVEQLGGDLLRMGRQEAALEESGTLTGRIPLWIELWDYVQQRPLLGHGYSAFWTAENFAAVESEIEWGPATAHSSYLECLLDLGWVGLVIMLLGILLLLIRLTWITAKTRRPEYAFVLGQFIFALTFSITEAGLRSPTTATFFMALGLASVLLFGDTSEPPGHRNATADPSTIPT